MRRLNLVLFLLGVVFLAFLLAHVGPARLWHELGRLGWGLLPFLLCEGIAEMIHTIGWRYCLVEPYRSLSWWRLFQIRMAGYAINYLTPTAALGGEATKVNLLAAYQRGPDAVSGVLIEKMCFAGAQVLFVVIGSGFILAEVHLPGSMWFPMLASVGVVTTGIVTFFLLQKHGKLGGTIRWLAARHPANHTLQKMAEQFTRVDDALRIFYRRHPRNLWFAGGWHLIGFSIGIFQTWYFAHLLGLPATFFTAAAIWFLGMWFDLLTFAVPLNVGTLEGSRMVVFKSVGLAALPGMTYGIATRFAQMAWACFGLILYGLLTARQKDPIIAPSIPANASRQTAPVSHQSNNSTVH